MIKGDRVKRQLPAKYKVPVRHGVITAVEQGGDNLDRPMPGYRVRFDDEPKKSKPMWYAAKGDFIYPE